MKVLLIQPPIRDFYHTPIRTQPLGLAYVAASLKIHGFDVEILDCQTSEKRSLSLPAEFSYLKEFYPSWDHSPFRLYTGFYHFGMDWEKIKQRIRDSKADVFGISSAFTPYHEEAMQVARLIKEDDHRRVVVMGGCHVSSDPQTVIESPWVDYVVLGEGELRLPVLLKQIEKGQVGGAVMDGVGFKEDGGPRVQALETFIEDLDELPYPSRELLDLDRYRVGTKRSTMILTSRGCPHRCAYCSARLVMGSTFRARSPESVIREMVECRGRYHIDHFDIEDDNFTYDRKRAKQLMSLLIETFGEETLELSAMNGVSYLSLDRELLGLMRRAGFKTINLSFVSTDPALREKVGRPWAPEAFDEVLRGAQEAELNVIAYAILGMPGQTIEEMVDTLIYLMGKRVLIGPSIYYPTPGTSLFEECKARGILPLSAAQWRSSALPIVADNFDRLDLVTLFRLTRLINFIKGRMNEEELSEGMTWRELHLAFRGKAEETGMTLRGAMTWKDLLRVFFEENAFFSLRKDPTGREAILMEKTSRTVLDAFLEKAWDKPILRSLNTLRGPSS